MLNLTVTDPDAGEEATPDQAAANMKAKSEGALTSVSKLQDSNAMNMWVVNIAKGLLNYPPAEFVPKVPAVTKRQSRELLSSRRLQGPMSSADELSSTVRSSLMSAVASAMGSSVVTTDSVLESIQSLAAATGSGQMPVSEMIAGLSSAYSLALSVQGESITPESVERFFDVLSNLKPSNANPVTGSTDLVQLSNSYDIVSHMVADSYFVNFVAG